MFRVPTTLNQGLLRCSALPRPLLVKQAGRDAVWLRHRGGGVPLTTAAGVGVTSLTVWCDVTDSAV